MLLYDVLNAVGKCHNYYLEYIFFFIEEILYKIFWYVIVIRFLIK